MAFRGWPAEALEFYEGLEADNSKAYWTQHKAIYDTAVLAPMQELLDELVPEWGEGRIFRPYRDVRFSADKSPYKTSMAATLGAGYVQLTSKGLGAGAGLWEMAPDQIERYRQAVVDDASGSALVGIVATMRKAKVDVMSPGELKTAPKGYPKDHPRVEFLRYKGLAAWQDWPAGPWLGTRKAKDRVVKFLTTAKPLTEWLNAEVGPSTQPLRRR